MTHDLIDNLFYKYFGNDILAQKGDSALIPPVSGRVVTTTDSFVVNPIFFTSGDIGKLAVTGTVNDLVMSGAKPLYLTVGLIIEEGLQLEKLEAIIESIGRTAEKAEVKVVTGDTKVVEKGSVDQIYINTTGIGVIKDEVQLTDGIETGDKVIINGSVGDHGASIMAERDELGFDSSIKSDCGLLDSLVEDILAESNGIKLLTDPTRGGLATALKEITNQNQVSICLKEERIPVKKEVNGICEILGLDPLYLANEGKVIAVASSNEAERILEIMKHNPQGEQAEVIGTVVDNNNSRLSLETKLGGTRVLSMLTNELLPRLC